MKKIIALGIAGSLVAYAIATPYIAVYQISDAAHKKDAEALSSHIDFPSVRQSIKSQINQNISNTLQENNLKDNLFSELGMALAGAMVDTLVESYVSPAGISKLISGQKFLQKVSTDTSENQQGNQPKQESKSLFSQASMSYKSLDKFEVVKQSDNGDQLKFILSRSGLSWKITDIILPKIN
ncbi:hypothetical protein HNQ59_000527 [Chitinivorax tropicus]|uniref:DUF2939 domain-containing protein n=1 Tax=Chitinivorax tropicus TaxID=714531 RepID=A0A840MM38_9PROT|nr:DUF2939 domain-containing protein [Chitinivorax tropicus]MBB5017263.1 hypothetical protein [Chitinivorax tropicus]